MWPFWSTGPSFQEVVRSKRAEREARLTNAKPFVADEHQVFLDADASEIVRRIAKGDWTASRVLDAYIARAAQAHEITNCLTEVLFEQARRDAELLDKEFAASGKLKGPLHGVPFSVKDQLDVAGVDTTIGYTRWAHNPATADASVVRQLRAAGAIPFTKTNIPQTLLAFESSNPLWGRTTNPYSAAHTSGGSSGGEAALLAMSGTVIGIGSDLGGSLRTPTHYCGVYSLKPGFGRVAVDGARDPGAGFEAIRSVLGPMGRSVADIEAAAKVLFGVRDLSYFPAPIPYRTVELPKKLRIGYYIRDDFIKTSPACQRAVLETVEALRREGHECIEFVPYGISRALELFVALTSADGYKTLLSHLGPDPKEPNLFLTILGPSLPAFVHRLALWIIKSFMGDEIFAEVLSHSRHKSVEEFYKYVVQRDEFVQTWTNEVWVKNEFDAIIAPTQATPAIPHGGCTNLSPLAAAVIIYNIVDSPVGVVPVTRVDPERDQLSDEWRARAGGGCKTHEHDLYAKGVYDPVKMKGLPVGVQVVGRPWEEEKVIALMHVVDKALGPRGFGPGSWKP